MLYLFIVWKRTQGNVYTKFYVERFFIINSDYSTRTGLFLLYKVAMLLKFNKIVMNMKGVLGLKMIYVNS